jgi:hypothetical protein
MNHSIDSFDSIARFHTNCVIQIHIKQIHTYEFEHINSTYSANSLRCSNTLYMYDMDVGCSLKGSTASTIA